MGTKKIQLRHINLIEVKLHTDESDRHGNNIDTGRSPGAKSAHNTHKHDILNIFHLPVMCVLLSVVAVLLRLTHGTCL